MWTRPWRNRAGPELRGKCSSPRSPPSCQPPSQPTWIALQGWQIIREAVRDPLYWPAQFVNPLGRSPSSCSTYSPVHWLQNGCFFWHENISVPGERYKAGLVYKWQKIRVGSQLGLQASAPSAQAQTSFFKPAVQRGLWHQDLGQQFPQPSWQWQCGGASGNPEATAVATQAALSAGDAWDWGETLKKISYYKCDTKGLKTTV